MYFGNGGSSTRYTVNGTIQQRWQSFITRYDGLQPGNSLGKYPSVGRELAYGLSRKQVEEDHDNNEISDADYQWALENIFSKHIFD